jgi:peptide-methionine (S)-S-oxide reductase
MMETAIFGGGCFWCTEAVYKKVKGVEKVTSGYAGGIAENPKYEEVSTGNTEHAEVVKIEFNPRKISYKQLLEIFWEIHDPTSINRQGNDVGSQYRSIILYENENQRKEAMESKERLEESGRWDKPVVTEIKKLDKFFTAEDYHKNYYEGNPEAPYCSIVIAPKIKHFEEKFKDWLKE